MDVVQRWSERIARRVAPDEADFAAEVGAAYAAGGQARKDLLPRPGTQPGAFGPGANAADLPLILQGLAHAATALLAFLRSPYVGNALAAAGMVIAFRAERHHEQAAPQATPLAERQALETAFGSLRDRLASAGFTRARADELACDLLEELLADTAEAAQFVDALAAVPDSGGGRIEKPAAAHGGQHRKHRRP